MMVDKRIGEITLFQRRFEVDRFRSVVAVSRRNKAFSHDLHLTDALIRGKASHAPQDRRTVEV